MKPDPHVKPPLVENTPAGSPRRAMDESRLAPFLALLAGVAAAMKSMQYHDIGQLSDERGGTLLLAGISACFVIASVPHLRRWGLGGRRMLVVMLLLCLLALSCDTWAMWNLSTAKIGQKDRWWH